MKRTKSMIYKETTEATELFLYTVNDSMLYDHALYIINNLKKKQQKGIYDKEKAVDLWYYHATEASEKYYKDYGYKFSVQDRFTVATDLEEHYNEEVFADPRF